jgi:16S rRNA (guanine527-N7)-methyltransferase
MTTGDVSRETPPPPPPGAADLFGQRLGLAKAYAELLAGAGVERGLIGPREVPRLWERHLVNCVLVADAFEHGSSVCDVGSGAGLPGIVLAIARPDLHVTLLEPLLRRTTFLEEVVEQLGLENVQVRRGRAEDQSPGVYDAVTARAVAPIDRLARWALPLCRPGGRLVALKGASAAEELDQHARALRRLGARRWHVREFVHPPARAVAIEVVAGETESRARGTTRRRSGGNERRQKRRT